MELFVEERALKYTLTQNILKKFPNYTIISNYEDYKWENLPEEELITLGKRKLFLIHYLGDFLKPCPGTKNYICCGYKIFHIGEGCPLDCSYCILQIYLNRPGLKIWANLLEDGLPFLERYLEESKRKNLPLRVGTGEFTDSLALEAITGISKSLIDLWKNFDPFALLELKTKISLSENFFSDIVGDRRVIFAWSVNTERIIRNEERGTASLEARIKSAELAIKKGFSVAFHFDPIVLYPEAEEEYPALLETLLRRIPLQSIAWISFGTLRYPKALKDIAEKRFPQTKIYSSEFIEGLDKKKRYFIEIRKKLYKAFSKLIKETMNEITYYYCMESERIWKEILNENITKNEELISRLDRVVKKLCFL